MKKNWRRVVASVLNLFTLAQLALVHLFTVKLFSFVKKYNGAYSNDKYNTLHFYNVQIEKKMYKEIIFKCVTKFHKYIKYVYKKIYM